MIATDSAWGRSSEAQLVTQNEQQGIGLRHYRLIGESEIQGIVYYDNVRRGLVGGSWVSVLNSTWGVHSSWLYQREYWQYQRQTEQPIELVKQENAAQFLFGINWANPEGHNVIAEYWYDGRSWNADEWQQILADATLLHQQGRSPMAFAYAQGYQATNLVAHNFMLHWTWDSGNGQRFGMDNLTPTLDVLWSPEEGGWMITQWINWQAYDTGSASLELELAARFFGGETDSAYVNLPDSVRVLFNLKGKF
ncbi:lipoprotein [Vibrio cholerae]|nr:lipoprotein [Vibrio cholerae]CSB99436.1 lipoprotein [Vibrio cholerae]CSC55304.1 lipoprotein [Vibrio cholerae]